MKTLPELPYAWCMKPQALEVWRGICGKKIVDIHFNSSPPCHCQSCSFIVRWQKRKCDASHKASGGFRRGYKYCTVISSYEGFYIPYLCLRFGLLDTLDKPLQYQCFSQPIPLNGFIHNRHLTRSVKQLSVAAPSTITVTPPTQQYQY